jgi:hypothetical protein
MSKIILDSLEILKITDEPGGQYEFYLYARKDDEDDSSRVRYPSGKGTIKVDKKVNAAAALNISIEAQNVLYVRLMESDSSTGDDDYGQDSIAANSDHGFVDYADHKQNNKPNCFRIRYHTEN